MNEIEEQKESEGQTGKVGILETEGTHNGQLQSVGGAKPLHRFTRGQPRILGVMVLFFGCGELISSLPMSNFDSHNILLYHQKTASYIPIWLGALFIIAGGLSIYTEMHLSKKSVIACLAMYVVSLLGELVSLLYRGVILSEFSWRMIRSDGWERSLYSQKLTMLAVLLTSSLLVSILLLFQFYTAVTALRSSGTHMLLFYSTAVKTQAQPAQTANPTADPTKQ